MGPQPPLKRRPTYTRPCKRDISAKLTPVGVHPHTRTGAKSQAIILLADRYIYIYIRTYIYLYTHARRYRGHESIPHCHKPRHISTITDSFPPCVLRGLPTGIRLVFPGYFRFPTFPPLPVLRHSSIPFPSWCLREFSSHFILYRRSSNRLREIQFRRYYDDWPYPLSLSFYLSIQDAPPISS